MRSWWMSNRRATRNQPHARFRARAGRSHEPDANRGRGGSVTPELQELLVAYRVVRPALLPVLPAAVLTLFGLLALLVDVFELGRTRGPAEGEEGTPIMAPYLALIGTALALGCVAWQAARLETGGGPYFSGMVVMDGFGVFLSGVVLAGTFLTLLLTIGYCRRHDIHLAEYYHLIL